MAFKALPKIKKANLWSYKEICVKSESWHDNSPFYTIQSDSYNFVTLPVVVIILTGFTSVVR